MAPWKTELDPQRQHKLDAMAEELCRQSAHLTAAEYRWLRLLGEFDEASGWVLAGARSCAAWLSWACGEGAAVAAARLRVVWRRLEDARDAAKKHEQRYVRHWVDEDGFVCVSARLIPDDGGAGGVTCRWSRLGGTRRSRSRRVVRMRCG
jgi:hypothetical protein